MVCIQWRKIGQGRDNAKKYLKDNPAAFEEIDAAVRKHYNLENGEKTDESAADTDTEPAPKTRSSKASKTSKETVEKETEE